MVGALLVVALALVGVLYGGKKNVALAAFSAIIGAIALFIAFPSLLSFGGAMSPIALLVVGLIGLVILLSAFASKKTPTGVFLLIGAIMIAWALFRWLPSGPAAFQYLGAHVTTAGNELWDGIKGFFKILAQSKPIKNAGTK